MKKKIVIWGADEADKKVLLALELQAKDNKVAIHSFPEEIATEMFYNELMENWRADKEVAFPEGHTTIVRELNMTDAILPENIKVQRTDLINRATTEWHFVVLSTKLYELYKGELEEKREKIMEMARFETSAWDEMKEFWNKVQSQVFDNNLLRNHANQLKDGTNKLFDKLKELRTIVDKEFDDISKKNKVIFAEKLAAVEEKIDKGLGLKPLFEELKSIQNEYKNSKFNKKDRSEIWNRIDGAFKKVKEKKFGSSENTGSNTALGRLTRRYNGLLSAIGKMEHSIGRDEKDIAYENKKINTTDGQLEQQIRQAKLKMIEERINSKKAKLNEMLVTKKDLEAKMDKEKKKEEVIKAKAAAKQKIAKDIETKTSELSSEEQEKLEKAAKELSDNKAKKAAKPAPEAKAEEPKAEEAKLAEKVEEVVEASVAEKAEAAVEEKVEEAKEEVKEETKEAMEEAVEAKAEEVAAIADNGAEATEESAGIMGAIGGLVTAAKDIVEDAVDSVTAMADVAKDTVSEALTGEEVPETVDQKIIEDAPEGKAEKLNALLSSEPKTATEQKDAVSGGLLGAAAGLVGGLVSKATELADEAKDKMEDIVESVETKVDDMVNTVTDGSETGGEEE